MSSIEDSESRRLSKDGALKDLLAEFASTSLRSQQDAQSAEKLYSEAYRSFSRLAELAIFQLRFGVGTIAVVAVGTLRNIQLFKEHGLWIVSASFLAASLVQFIVAWKEVNKLSSLSKELDSRPSSVTHFERLSDSLYAYEIALRRDNENPTNH
jgi:hypothetical protein